MKIQIVNSEHVGDHLVVASYFSKSFHQEEVLKPWEVSVWKFKSLRMVHVVTRTFKDHGEFLDSYKNEINVLRSKASLDAKEG